MLEPKSTESAGVADAAALAGVDVVSILSGDGFLLPPPRRLGAAAAASLAGVSRCEGAPRCGLACRAAAEAGVAASMSWLLSVPLKLCDCGSCDDSADPLVAGLPLMYDVTEIATAYQHISIKWDADGIPRREDSAED